MLNILHSLIGIAGIVLITWLLSEDRRQRPWRVIAAGLAVQFLVAGLLLNFSAFSYLFLLFNQIVVALQTATEAGTAFVFGYLGGAAAPFDTTSPNNGFILAFRALPLILLMSALSALLYYWRVLPAIVKAIAWLLKRSMGVGGALGLGAGANIFVGMIEAPLLIRPYLMRMTRSETFALMCCGMATIAGTMMALYATILGGVIDDAVGHILTASLISAPAALMIATVMIPENETVTAGDVLPASEARNAMDAITRGTMDGIKLLVGVIAMLLVLVALVSLVNQLLGFLPGFAGETLTLQRMLGWLMSPLAWLMGIPWSEATTVGALLGTKVILNEFIAYLDLVALPADALSERSTYIATYALCGFANLGSLGIMLGGLCTMAPERRGEFVELGGRSVVAGTLATCLTGTVAGILLPV